MKHLRFGAATELIVSQIVDMRKLYGLAEAQQPAQLMFRAKETPTRPVKIKNKCYADANPHNG